jgi:hypothetical protein
MDNVRPSDATIYSNNGVDWVKAVAGKGISTSGAPKPRGRWWFLPANTAFSGLLLVFNDYGNHWLCEPVQNMPLADYRAALAALHPYFQ